MVRDGPKWFMFFGPSTALFVFRPHQPKVVTITPKERTTMYVQKLED